MNLAMALVLFSGTQLESVPPAPPLTRAFLIALGATYLLAMHFFMPNPGGSGLALSFNPTTWLMLSLAIAIGLVQVARFQTIRYTQLTLVLLLCCVIMTVPVFFHHAYAVNAVSRLVGLWAGWLLFLLLQQFYFSNAQKQRLLWFIVLASLIEALLGWSQYFQVSPSQLLGFQRHIPRPYGIFQQPNVMASFLATGWLLSAYLLARQPKKYQRKLNQELLLYLIPVLCVPLLFILASRTGWIASILGAALLIGYLREFADRRRLIIWLISCGFGLALGIASLMQGSSTNIVMNKADLESPRLYTFPQALDMVIERPFTGYGYGNFEAQYMLYTARQHQLNSAYPPGLPSMDHPHNETLFWAVEGGMIPLLGMAIAAGFTLRQIYRAKANTRLAMLALLTPILLHSQLEYPFYHSAIHWISFIVLLYWIDQRVARFRSISLSRYAQSGLKITSLVLPVCVSAYMLTTLHTNWVLTQFERSNPRNPELLSQVTNPIAWQDRFDWDIYSSYLALGLQQQKPEYIQPYIDWSQSIILHKPRPAFYQNLILAYQGIGNAKQAEQIRSEAEFLFPQRDFSQVDLSLLSQALSSAKE